MGRSGTAVRRQKQVKVTISPRQVEVSGTALHAAAEGGHVNVVTVLLQTRANINKRLKYDDSSDLCVPGRAYGCCRVASV